jgi:hypothetical protein
MGRGIMHTETLNDTMEFEHVIRVLSDGGITEPIEPHAPDLDTYGDDADLIASAKRQGWELLAGWTGQYGYAGPVMHASEYIGGALARWILSNPGLYVALVVESDDTQYEPDAGAETEPAGWCVAYREDGA